MSSFGIDGFGVHTVEWLASTVLVLLLIASRIAMLRLISGCLRRKGDTEERESDYWRIHGG